MKSKTKALLMLLCALALVVASVFGTIAYLTDTQKVTNTFTVGNVQIKLDEAMVKENGEEVTTRETDSGSAYVVRTEDGNTYHLLPGHTYVKDPTVTILEGSEESYIRMMVKVENLDSLKAAIPAKDNEEFYAGDLFLLQNLCVDKDGELTWDNNVWKFVKFHDASDTKYPNTYEFRYVENGADKRVVGPVDNKDNIVDGTALPALFGKITVPGFLDNDAIANLANVKIEITAHAIQADGFGNSDLAWAAFDAQN